MFRVNRFGFLSIAVVFHLVYVYSIFDIYFVSPIVHGMKAYSTQSSGFGAPAQRLVLFVGDGLRADKAFQSFPDPSPSNRDASTADVPRPLMPFLRSRVEKHGTFGVSHTRVPTESRPGHVALIAGLYDLGFRQSRKYLCCCYIQCDSQHCFAARQNRFLPTSPWTGYNWPCI